MICILKFHGTFLVHWKHDSLVAYSGIANLNVHVLYMPLHTAVYITNATIRWQTWWHQNNEIKWHCRKIQLCATRSTSSQRSYTRVTATVTLLPVGSVPEKLLSLLAKLYHVGLETEHKYYCYCHCIIITSIIWAILGYDLMYSELITKSSVFAVSSNVILLSGIK